MKHYRWGIKLPKIFIVQIEGILVPKVNISGSRMMGSWLIYALANDVGYRRTQAGIGIPLNFAVLGALNINGANYLSDLSVLSPQPFY